MGLLQGAWSNVNCDNGTGLGHGFKKLLIISPSFPPFLRVLVLISFTSCGA